MDLLLRKMKTTAEDARKWSFEAKRYKEEMEVILYNASWPFTHTHTQRFFVGVACQCTTRKGGMENTDDGKGSHYRHIECKLLSWV